MATTAQQKGGRGSEASARSGSCRDRDRTRRKESVMSTAATMRVLNVLKHWISKHGQVIDCLFK